MKHLLAALVRVWRRIISPYYGDVCRYHPSCSAYALEAIEVHGAIKGPVLAAWRIVRCNPWSRGGYDPVPGTEAARAWEAEQASGHHEGADGHTFPHDLPERMSGASHNTRGEI